MSHITLLLLIFTLSSDVLSHFTHLLSTCSMLCTVHFVNTLCISYKIHQRLHKTFSGPLFPSKLYTKLQTTHSLSSVHLCECLSEHNPSQNSHRLPHCTEQLKHIHVVVVRERFHLLDQRVSYSSQTKSPFSSLLLCDITVYDM